MEVLSVKNLDFQYEAEEKKVLQNINIHIKKGETVLFCGPCGCGKTTLFRMLKEELRPSGNMQGEIKNLYKTEEIGYLFQNPDSQIVCQTVEEELVFGAENIGLSREEMVRDVAELTAYLGIEDLLWEKCTELSGGQKQMVNLASVLLMKPQILLLDEPVSQLDPVSTYEFIQLIRKLREDLNLTILIIEHNLDAFLNVVDRVVYMEEGCIDYQGNADGFVTHLLCNKKSFCHSLPETIKVSVEAQGEKQDAYPYTVKELLEQKGMQKKLQGKECNKKEKSKEKSDELLSVKAGYFRYEKQLPDVLRGIDFSMNKGEIYGLIGGNGSGKSTLFSVLSGYRKLYRGKYHQKERVGVLPQNPVYAFFKDVLKDDFKMIASEEKIEEILGKYEFCQGVREYLHKNPLDLSGGQMQKAAIVKMLLNDAKLLLMDEPVKAMDGYEKYLFSNMLKELKEDGKTICFISHDLEFVEKNADQCFMMFKGKIIAKEKPEKMFYNNRFYTTVRGKIKGMMKNEWDVNQ